MGWLILFFDQSVGKHGTIIQAMIIDQLSCLFCWVYRAAFFGISRAASVDGLVDPVF